MAKVHIRAPTPGAAGEVAGTVSVETNGQCGHGQAPRPPFRDSEFPSQTQRGQSTTLSQMTLPIVQRQRQFSHRNTLFGLESFVNGRSLWCGSLVLGAPTRSMQSGQGM
jgi:hypothetical protein